MSANYTKQVWVNGPGGSTPISAARLNWIEDGIDNVDAVLTAALAGKMNAGAAPTAHATTHGSGGSDPITLAQSQITGLATALSTINATTADHESRLDAIETDNGLHGATHGPAGPDRTVVMGGNDSPNRLDVVPRGLLDGQTAMVSGNVDLAYVSSNINKTINRIRVIVGSTGYTAGTGGPPTCRLGLYAVDASTGNLTLVARTAVIAAATLTANTIVDVALDSAGGYVTSYDLLYASRYAVGIIWLDNGATGHVIPQFGRYEATGPNSTVRGSIFAQSPRMTGRLTGQTDLPASITAGSVTNCPTHWALSLFNSANAGV